MDKKAEEPRRWSIPTQLTSGKEQGPLKTEGSTHEAGDPQPKLEPARDSLSLSFELIAYP